VREAILAEKQERGLHPHDGWDLLAERGKTHARVDRINGERAAEAGRLSQQVLGISNALVDLGMLPIQAFPNFQSQLGRTCQWLVLFWSTYKKRWPPPHRLFIFLFLLSPVIAVIYILTYIYIY
jgi:hypothetical protein